MEASRLNELRIEIDKLDNEILILLAKRFELTEKVGVYKAENKLNAQDKSRELKQFEKIIQLSNKHGMNSDYGTAIYRCIMDLVISRHKELEETIQKSNV
ncbi:chorismate mutase [Paenibacillus castaneae]|uniref:chorismate mutase n=1 Tax=Paenibacillus castaneae TaxID=474957 RepID=UPI000C9BBF08|nr:chorismate mutase [Paenibacillus castaneae]NIK77204.1 chorismate mutase [Paenibacillus castaneae]